MTDDEFEDLLDEVYHYFPSIADDHYAQIEYARAVARVNNVGGEEQRAKMLELIDEMNAAREDEMNAAREDEEADRADEAAENEQWPSDGT